jgi:hypothetical protein
MSGRPPLHRKVKKLRFEDLPPPTPTPPPTPPENNAPPYFPAPFRFPFFPKEKNSFDPNFDTKEYARKKGLDIFSNNEIKSKTNGMLYFPNSTAAEIQDRGYEEAIHKNAPFKIPMLGDKLIYVEYSGPTTEVTLVEIDIPYIKLKNNSTGRVFVLNMNDYGRSYMLYKKKTMYQEEPVNWVIQRPNNYNFFEKIGGARSKSKRSRTKSRKLKYVNRRRKATRRNVR